MLDGAVVQLFIGKISDCCFVCDLHIVRLISEAQTVVLFGEEYTSEVDRRREVLRDKVVQTECRIVWDAMSITQ